jgi:A118 family predicted phage portal protein
MPLPSGGTWPPPALASILPKLSEWSAWYSGEPDDLAAVYGGQRTEDSTGFFASERGGWRASVGKKLERWFWGTRPTSAQPRTKLHVPLASDIAATSANLLYGEMISITSEDKTTQARLETLIEDSGLHSTLLESAELASALSGVFLRVCWDKKLRPDGPWLAPVHADAAIPEFRWGQLVAVTFWRIVADDGQKVLRHLERHEVGAIYHGLYEGDCDDLGHMIPLTEHEATAHLAEVVNAQGAVETRIPFLTASYVANIKPNRIWRNIPAAAYLGRADIQGVEPMLDGLDEVYSSWRRDIRLAKARLIVPANYLQSMGKGQGATFDLEQELYEGINSMSEEGGMEIHPQQFLIRHEEHRSTAADWLEQAVRGAGYSVQTFGGEGDVAATATEVIARQERSYTTRAKKIGYHRRGVGDALTALLAIDAAMFDSGVTPGRPTLEWPDGVATDPKALAETLNLLNQAEAVSTWIKVKILHPDWEDTEVQEEVDRIEEANQAVEDPFALPSEMVGPDGEPVDPEDPKAKDGPAPA